jgi:hypothetical protein
MRCPIHEVLAWPLWVVRTYAEFLQREPAVEERLELGIAQIAQLYAACHRPKGAAAPTLHDFLHGRDAWADPVDESRYSDVDLEIMRQIRR